MATKDRKLTPVTDQQIQGVENLLIDLKKRAKSAYEVGDMYMLTIYAELVKVVSPIVQKALARKDREEKANINRGVKALRKGEKPVVDQQQSA